MKLEQIFLLATTLALAAAQQPSKAVPVNLDTAPFKQDKESEYVLLHNDPKNGATELLVRFPAGHIIPAHFHDSNERIIVAEGQLTLTREVGPEVISPGGYVYLPAQETQRLSCTSATRCSFYLIWDGSPKSHPVK